MAVSARKRPKGCEGNAPPGLDPGDDGEGEGAPSQQPALAR